ncbi:unnamed protein product [Caenorhabditis brenneri]
MPSKALSIKTHCRSIKDWLERSEAFIFTLFLSPFVRYYIMPSKALSRKTRGMAGEKCSFYSEIKNDFYTSLIVCYLFITLIFEFIHPFVISFYIKNITSPVWYWKCTIFNTILTVLMTILMINPIILKWYSEMDRSISDILFFLLCLHYETTPAVICTCPYVSYILWRMSKVKPDYDGEEPYLVIYGGEGSITKKLMGDSE